MDEPELRRRVRSRLARLDRLDQPEKEGGYLMIIASALVMTWVSPEPSVLYPYWLVFAAFEFRRLR